MPLKLTDKRNGKSFTVTRAVPSNPQIPVGGYNPAQVAKKSSPASNALKKMLS